MYTVIKWKIISLQVSSLFRRNGTIALHFATKSNVKSRKLVGSWLLTCSGMVFVAVVLGTACYFIFYSYIRKVIQMILDITYGK